MKRNYYLLLLVLPALINMATAPSNSNGKAGATGSPGEITCLTAGCHSSSNALNQGPGSLSLTSNIPASGYVPGVTYQMQLKVKETGRALFGFGLEALTSTNDNGGTLVVSDAVKTKIVNFTVSGIARKNMVHKDGGGASQDSAIFAFNWTAPALSTGDVTFYFAGNATNNNSTTSGDNIYTGTLIAKPTTSSTDEASIASEVDVFPNPVLDVCNIRYTLTQSSDVSINILSTEGRLLKHYATRTGLTGEQSEQIRMSELNVPMGVYFLELKTDRGSIMRKIFVSK